MAQQRWPPGVSPASSYSNLSRGGSPGPAYGFVRGGSPYGRGSSSSRGSSPVPGEQSGILLTIQALAGEGNLLFFMCRFYIAKFVICIYEREDELAALDDMHDVALVQEIHF